jgi:hypothetical protein
MHQGKMLSRLRLDQPDRVWVTLVLGAWALALASLALGSTLLA